MRADCAALLDRLRDLLHTDCITVNGRTLGANLDGAIVCNDEVIAPRDRPLGPEGGVAVLRGNLAPNGAVIKHTAAERRLLQHAGPAVVFQNYNDLEARIDDPPLPVTADSVLVLQDAGPLGAPGMPEWGMLPIPKKLLAQGVRDMVRISDARMSGTSYGACILHVAPESFVGGPLALRPRRRHHRARRAGATSSTLRVSDEELARRRADLETARSRSTRADSDGCTRSTSPRPIAAATSTFSKARRRSPSRKYTSSQVSAISHQLSAYQLLAVSFRLPASASGFQFQFSV